MLPPRTPAQVTMVTQVTTRLSLQLHLSTSWTTPRGGHPTYAADTPNNPLRAATTRSPSCPPPPPPILMGPQLSFSYPVGVSIKYDSSLHQVVAREKGHLIPWDQGKEDILMWCITRQPFQLSKQGLPLQLVPPTKPPLLCVPPLPSLVVCIPECHWSGDLSQV